MDFSKPSKKALIQKDFISYKISLVKKRKKQPLFERTVSCNSSMNLILGELAISLGNYKGNSDCVEYFEFDNFKFTPYQITDSNRDTFFYLDNKKNIYHALNKSRIIKGQDIRYSLKGERTQYRNNSFPNWKYLDNSFELHIEFIYDENGYKKALSDDKDYVLKTKYEYYI